METIDFDYFEKVIINSISSLDIYVPNFLVQLEASLSTEDTLNILDNFILCIKNLLIYPNFELQIKELVAIHTLTFSNRLQPLILKSLSESQLKSELICRYIILG